MELKKYKLGDCVEILDNLRVPLSSVQRKELEKVYPYFGAQGIIDYVDDFIFDGNYILVAEDGNNLKSRNEPVALWASGKFWVNNHAHILGEKNGFDLRYIYYAINNTDIKGYISGSAQPKLNQDNLKKIEILLPTIEVQRSISSFLSSVDSKIALNRAINRNLEALAKQLYDYWFVQFDFPDENGRPYKSSGGKMVWNEKLKRDIPVGWEVNTIYDIAEVYNGATPSTTDVRNYGGDVVWITPKDLSNQQQKFVYQGERNISKDGYDSCSTHLLPENTILMSSRAPIGLLAIAKAELCTNQGFKNFVPKNANASTYLYYYIQTHIKQIEQLGTGTTFKEVSRDDILKFLILKPCDEILVLWETMIDAVNDKQLEIQKENENLTRQRDELLPLLMNGQVTIE